MRKQNQTNALLVELLIVILFFMLGSSILIRVFGASYKLTGQADRMAQAMLEAQNTADTLYSAADIRQALEELGFTGTDSGSEGETWTRQDDGYTLQVTYAQEEMEHGVMNRMQVQAADGEEVMITLPCSRYDSIQT